MSNKAQVIFTFEQQSHTTTPAQGGVNVMDLVAARVEMSEMNEEVQAGPHDVCAVILKKKAPMIMQLIATELETGAKALGLDMTVCNVGQKNKPTSMH
ncbi:hypothetical protein DMA59_01725 [Salmonella enterica subsp. enterica serovar Potsdam]|uniref:Uncharacterized protein n=1 Tax=Salmonella potsdam TaxID=597 RepID=A0A5U6H6L1_SALPO|nr:hypothetical protein [Salmonella enterica]EBQ9424374.1 hypothetical protein [Salmonella enterica subsp. enterica serovar Potsdam]ECD7676056.1 hypothetical protein [Salmonella enterica subsp. enterica serovar Montevideo]EDT6674393.1 hypothetical protein [Salmonella enterica subsp. enterica]ECZ9690064.1 hypothetical protein [Salmonella enterica subsp. enterica serovar Potsdam]EDD1113892.1 hypothetical protein [Salmonella enterica subsp. enterica serovar Montevideo]